MQLFLIKNDTIFCSLYCFKSEFSTHSLHYSGNSSDFIYDLWSQWLSSFVLFKKNIFPDFNFWGSKKSTCYVIWRWREINWHQLKYLYSFSHGDLRVHNCKCKEEKRWKFVCVCIYLFIYFSVYLHFSHLVAYIFHYYSEKKKILSACLNVFLYFEFFLHWLYCMCALSITELILCYLKILSSCQQLIQLKSLNAVEVNSSSFTYIMWNKMSLQG